MVSGKERVVDSSTSLVLQSLENIHQEIEDLRRLIGEKPKVRRSLRGLLRGMEISDEAIEEAKHSWTKKIDAFE